MLHQQMKKTLEHLLKFILSLIKVSTLFVILILAIYLIYTFMASASGEEWCDKKINDFESDKNKFLKIYADRLHDGRITLVPTHKNKSIMGQFTAEQTGAFACSYSHGGMSKPHTYRYTSETRKWIKVD